jgi:Domain of Unknown Function (DUF1080)
VNRGSVIVLPLAIGIVMAGISMIAPSRADDKDDFKPLFNGKDLEGWEATEPELWSVKDGMIIGKQGKNQLKKNTFLATKEKYADFVLKASVRLVKDEGNSGIQFRTRILPDGTARGYQADVAKGFWGLLLDEGSPKRLIIKRPVPEAVKKLKPDEWNDYEITAKGHHITLVLNGIKSVDLEDPTGDLSGVIALQLHVGPAMEVQFKDIKIKELD